MLPYTRHSGLSLSIPIPNPRSITSVNILASAQWCIRDTRALRDYWGQKVFGIIKHGNAYRWYRSHHLRKVVLTVNTRTMPLL